MFRSPSSHLSKTLALIVAAAFAVGCGGGETGGQAGGGEAAAGAEGAAQAPMVDPATAGTIAGQVMFQGTPPAASPVDMSEEQTCADKYPSPKRTEQVVVNQNGTLKNVFVYVKEGLGDMTFPAPQQPVVLDQAGCWYQPRVFGIQVGQNLQIKNSDGVLHNINAKAELNRGFNISQPVVMETTRQFRAAEVMVRFECDVHGWMQAFGGVLNHPYYSVTGGAGGFSLQTLPPGTYTIEAWHEKYGTQTQQVTVGQGETKQISFTFSEPAA